MSEKFRNLILENNLDYIIIDNIKKDKNQNDLFFNLLKKITDKKSPYINFVKSFIKKNNKFVLDNYYSEIITHPMRKNLLKINTKELEIDSYSKVELLISKLLIEEENREKLEDINKNFKDKESSEIKEDIEQSIEIINNIKKEIKELTKNISFDFYYQKIESENIINAINLYYNGITGFSNLIYDKIENLTFEETKSLMHNKVFLNFIYNNKKSDSQIDNKRTLFLNKNFTNEQNIELIELMLINFNNNLLYKKTYEKKIELSSLLNLINKEKRFEISNDLVIKHDPENMFNSYDYIPNEEGYFSKHVREEFSVEQIMKAIEYLNIKNKKIICVSKPNLSHDNLLSNNYKNGNIKDYLRLLKNLENDPINYIAVIHSDIVQNFINKNDYKETFKYRDVAITDFYNKYINVDVVIEGMKQIFKTAKEYNENINYKNDNDNNTNEANLYNGIAVKNAINALRNFISFTYYSSSKDELISEFDIDKSKRILKEIIKDAPFLLFNTATIGKITNLMSEITNNFNEYIDKEFIDSLFLNSGKTEIISDMFSLDYEKRNEFWQSKIANKLIKKIIENLTSNEDIYSLQKLDFIIKQNIFNENLPYGKKLTDFSTQLTDFLCNKEYINMIEKSLLFVDLSTKTILIETNDKNKNKNKI